MTHPDIPSSQEGSSHRVTEIVIIDTDWSSRFHQSAAMFGDLGTELSREEDPQRVVDLVERRGRTLISTQGASALNLVKSDILAERSDFETRFGEL